MSAVVALLHDPAASPPTAAKPLSPARANLVAANVAVEAARAEFARLSEPANKLHEIKRDLATEQKKFAALKAADDVLLGRWITGGGAGPRPTENEERDAVERRIIGLVRDIGAVTAVQPGLDEAVNQAASRFAAAKATREAAFLIVVAESAAKFIDREFTARLTAMLESEAVIVSLFDVLRFSPTGSGNPAHRVAELIGQKLQEAKRNIGVPRNTEIGRKFLDRLRADPTAELG
jgi:hypothetical protein